MDVKKIILITNIPTPYRIPLFNELHRQSIYDNNTFKVIFAAKTYKSRKWVVNEEEFEFPFEYLDTDRSYPQKEKKRFSYRGIISTIKKDKPTHIIIPGFSKASLKVVLYSYFANFKTILWTGSILLKHERESFFKRLYRKFIILHINQFVVYSNLSKKYLASYGIDPNKITVSLNTVDLNFFKNSVKKVENDKQHNIHFTTISYLREAKNTEVLIHIFKELTKKYDNLIFNIIGEGDNELPLRKLVKNIGLDNKIIFHGYKQKNELPPFLAITDIFLFETLRDVWGLILNEAMASGLCCVCSINAPSSVELIEDGKNGFVVDFSQKDQVVNLLYKIIENKNLRLKIGELAQKSIFEKASIEKSATNFYRGISKD